MGDIDPEFVDSWRNNQHQFDAVSERGCVDRVLRVGPLPFYSILSYYVSQCGSVGMRGYLVGLIWLACFGTVR